MEKLIVMLRVRVLQPEVAKCMGDYREILWAHSL